MPTARRVLAAGLFAAVVAVSSPALASPRSPEPAAGRAMRPDMVNLSANAAEHGHSGKSAKTHGTHGTHGAHRVHGTTSGSGLRAASTATGSSGRVHGHSSKVHTARHLAATVASASSDATATTSHGKHLAKGAKKGAQPAKGTPSTGKPVKANPGKGAGKTTSTPSATKPGTVATTPPPAAAFDGTVPSASGPAAVAPRAVTRPVAHRTPKPRTGGTPDAGSPDLVPSVNPKQALGGLGRTLTRLTGIGLFSGPQGWIFTGMLLLAVAMMIGAFALGRRPRSAG